MVCDKVVCVRWCVCDKVAGDKAVCSKEVCERWYVTKLCVKDGVCDKDVCVCERWCVTKLYVTKMYVKDGV